MQTRITKNVLLANNQSTESSAGGTLLYVANHLSYKPYLDLNVYKINELESTFRPSLVEVLFVVIF